MTTHGSVAAKVRKERERAPERFCDATRFCLHRRPCPVHSEEGRRARLLEAKRRTPRLYCEADGCTYRVRMFEDEDAKCWPCPTHGMGLSPADDATLTRLVTALRTEQPDEPGNDYEGD